MPATENTLLLGTDVAGTPVSTSLNVPVPPVDEVNRYYRYIINGSGAMTFFKETGINLSSKTVTILIQTDKAIYKPGQIVQFRCMAVYSDLKPYLGNFNIEIKDPQDNKMAKWTAVKGPSGVFSSEFPLASAPLLENWQIVVKVPSGESKVKQFKVEEFVLPKVEVKIQLPTFFHSTRVPLVVGISAVYTFGKGIKGIAHVNLRVNQQSFEPLTRSVKLVNGKTELKYREEDLLRLLNCPYCGSRISLNTLRARTLNVSVQIVDDIAGEEFYADQTIHWEHTLFRLKFLGITPVNFKPGITWRGFMQLTLPDGSPPLPFDTNDEILDLTYTCTGEKESEFLDTSIRRKFRQRYIEFPKNGIVTIQANIPEDTSRCDIRAIFSGGGSDNYVIEKYLSREKQGLQLSAPGVEGQIEPGERIKFVLHSNVPIEKYYYQLLSKGHIVKQGIQTGGGKRNSFVILFDAGLARKTSPTGRILVWYLTDGNEIIVDSLDFTINGAFANKVSLSFSAEEVKPADNISLTVSAHQNSHVGILVVDQSVLLLADGNDISQKEVLNELSRFDTGAARYREKPRYCRYCYFPVSSGGSNTREVISIMAAIRLIISPPRPVHRPAPRPVPGTTRPKQPTTPGPLTSGEDLVEPDRIRSLFPETWIWIDQNAGFDLKPSMHEDVLRQRGDLFHSVGAATEKDMAYYKKDGKVVVSEIAPDTITSWVASAFAMSSDVGLGIADESAKLVVFKSFFVQINLPFSVIRGELLELKVLVFNFLKKPQNVTVSLEKSPNDEFFVRNEGEKRATKSKESVQTVTIDADDGEELIFWIKPVKLGQVPVQVKAQSTQAADALRRMLLVEPEGIPQVYTKSFFIQVDKGNSFSEKLDLLFPENLVEGSEEVVFSAVGDIMGPTMSNLGSLLRLPSGCGEQNMISFAPNIFVLDYLKATDQLTTNIAQKAKTFMLKGYQNQLRYQRNDGSFSAFGDQDKAGSMWLTAFVLRSFERAKPYTVIEDDIIDRGIRFIMNNKEDNGSFKEPKNGRTIHTDMQGGASEGTPLTAYVLITLIELKDSITNTYVQNKVIKAINETLDHLVKKLPKVKEDVYAMALITFALTIAGHPQADDAYMNFNKLATVDDSFTKFWKRGDQELTVVYSWRPPYVRMPSNSIEMTAYGACISLLRGNIDEAAVIIRWLSAQRSSFGGYHSTQDTVVGIDALAKFASEFSRNKQNLDISVIGEEVHKFPTLDNDNRDILHQHQLTSAEIKPSLIVKAEGSGSALVQMSVFYNKKENKDKAGFVLTIKSVYIQPKRLQTNICFRYNVNRIASGMVVLEVDQLTGHVPVTDNLLTQYKQAGLKKWELLSGKKLALYWDEVTKNETCIKIISVINQRVEDLQHALCAIYSYYRTEISDSKLYLPSGRSKDTSLPIICKSNLKKCGFALSNSGKGKSKFINKGIAQLTLKNSVTVKDYARVSSPIIINYNGLVCVETSAKVSAKSAIWLTFKGRNSVRLNVPQSSDFDKLEPVELDFQGGEITVTFGGIEGAINGEVLLNKLNIRKGGC